MTRSSNKDAQAGLHAKPAAVAAKRVARAGKASPVASGEKNAANDVANENLPGTALAGAAPRRQRGNKRSEQTIENIFAATEKIVLGSGVERISILEICSTAQISRGTFYRYFSSHEELLDAYSRHKRERFHEALVTALLPYEDPDQRFAEMVKFLDEYLIVSGSRRLLVVAPEFALNHFKRIFNDAIVRFQDLLAPVFAAWDERLGVKLDRQLICELMIRLILSEHIVGGESDRRMLPQRIGRMIHGLRYGGVSRTKR